MLSTYSCLGVKLLDGNAVLGKRLRVLLANIRIERSCGVSRKQIVRSSDNNGFFVEHSIVSSTRSREPNAVHFHRLVHVRLLLVSIDHSRHPRYDVTHVFVQDVIGGAVRLDSVSKLGACTLDNREMRLRLHVFVAIPPSNKSGLLALHGNRSSQIVCNISAASSASVDNRYHLFNRGERRNTVNE